MKPIISDIMSILALGLSALATVKTIQFNSRQKSLIKSQEELNKKLLKKEDEETILANKADLSASFVKIGSSNYRLKIWNKGKSAARNVMIEFPEGNDYVSESELKGKFPLEYLETHQFVELIASIHLQSKRKTTIKILWSDEFSKSNEKLVYPTI